MIDPRLAVAASYLIAAIMAFFAGRTSELRNRFFWYSAATLLLLMGIAKGLQLEDEVTGRARNLVKAAGWYDAHEEAQRLFAGLLAIVLLITFGLLASRLRQSSRAAKAAAASLSFLVTFVLIRAASFHAVDAWVVHPWLGMRLGWWVELAGIAAVGGSAVFCIASRKCAP